MFLTHPQVQILAERVPAGGITIEPLIDGAIFYTEGDGRIISIDPYGNVKVI
jgi:hypothetical protein